MASSYEDPDQVVNYYYSNEEQLNQIQNMVLEEQVVENVIEKATVSEVVLPYEEAIQPVPPAVEAPEDDDEAIADQGERGEESP